MNDIEEAISYIENTKKHLLHLGETWYADYLDDAIELLKEQDARVLSLSEALCLKKHDEIWLEYTGCHNKLFMLTISRVRRYGLTFFNHLPCPWEQYGKAPESETDWSWRVWTAKPTEEQRMAVKWE